MLTLPLVLLLVEHIFTCALAALPGQKLPTPASEVLTTLQGNGTVRLLHPVTTEHPNPVPSAGHLNSNEASSYGRSVRNGSVSDLSIAGDSNMENLFNITEEMLNITKDMLNANSTSVTAPTTAKDSTYIIVILSAAGVVLLALLIVSGFAAVRLYKYLKRKYTKISTARWFRKNTKRTAKDKGLSEQSMGYTNNYFYKTYEEETASVTIDTPSGSFRSIIEDGWTLTEQTR